MIQELYINSVLMDVDEKFNVALLYDSMLFTDIEKLMSNRSTGFSLPKTANNLRAIEHAELSDIQDDPSVEILYPRRNHKVDYYQNGVPIVTNALGVMLDISDRINFVFIFGNMENTRHLEKKLSELPEDADTFVPWNSSSTVKDYGGPWISESPGFAYMDYGRGFPSSSNMQFHHPVVGVNWIIGRIEAANGLTIDASYLTHFRNMFIPLVTKNVSPKTGKETGVGSSVKIDKKGWFSNLITWLFAPNNPEYQTPALYPSNAAYPAWTFKGGMTDPVRIMLNGGQPFDVTMNKQDSGGYEFGLSVGKSNNTSIIIPGETVVNNERIITKRYTVDITVDVSDVLYWSLILFVKEGDANNLFEDLTLPDSWVWIQKKEVPFPGQFPVIPNLPDMKQVAFLKHMMQLRGLFAYPKGLNHIGLISADELIAKKADALNWTDKLITDSPIPNAPEGIDFKMANFAQTNWFRYDNNDEVDSLNTDAILTVYNETIERERETLKLPFSGSQNVTIGEGDDARPIATIPLYDADDKMAKLNQRVLMGRTGGPLEVSFESLGFSHIINTYYSGYQRIIEHPRVLSVRVKLTDLDLSGLDLTRPVYFEQFGRHYAILSVQAQTDGLCKCKLLEI